MEAEPETADCIRCGNLMHRYKHSFSELTDWCETCVPENWWRATKGRLVLIDVLGLGDDCFFEFEGVMSSDELLDTAKVARLAGHSKENLLASLMVDGVWYDFYK